jgi:Fe-S cluster biogenesis protein NfuA
MAGTVTPSVREAGTRIDALLEQLAAGAPPGVAERTTELLQCVMALYGAGLERIVAWAAEVAPDGVRDLAADQVVGGLLVLHDLHPDDVDTRVQRALDDVRPYLGSHAGGVRYDGVDAEGVAHLRLEGSCDGCPGSTLTVRNAIEQAVLAAAPDVVRIETEGVVAEDGPELLQIGRYRPEDCPVPS